MRIVIAAGLWLALYTNVTVAQQFKFNHFSAEKGLPQQYVYDIEQTKNGYLWIATSEGLVRFDGDVFQSLGIKDGLAEDFTTHLLLSSAGEMWAGHNQGSITKMQTSGKFKKVITSVAEFGAIAGITETPDKKVLAVGQSGKVLISAKNIEETYDLAGGDFLVYSMAVTNTDLILLGTESGLLSYKLKKSGPVISSKRRIESIPDEKIQSITPSRMAPGVFWVATSAGKIYKLTFNQNGAPITEVYSDQWNTPLQSVQHIFEDTDGNLWISTLAGVLKFAGNAQSGKHAFYASYSLPNGLPGDQVKCTFQDAENNIWFGMYGSGLAMLKDEFFSFYTYKNIVPDINVRSILTGKNSVWLGTDNGVIRMDGANQNGIIYNDKNGLVNEPVTALCFHREYVLAGTSKAGLFAFDRITEKWKNVFVSPDDALANSVMDIEAQGDDIWLATRGGLVHLNSEFEMQKIFNTEVGMSHNSINDALIDKSGKIWACSQGNIVSVINNGEIEQVEITGPSQSINITCITEDKKGQIWVGTYGNGVFKQEGKKFKAVTSANGLASDYCYFIQAGDDNEVWVGHRGSLSRMNQSNSRITVFENSDGINCDFNELACFKDEVGHLWFGSNKGTIKFDPKKYVINRTQPMVNIKSLILSDKEIKLSKLIELPYGNYRLTINFIGINFTNPEKVKYKFILKGFDLAWSNVTDVNQAYYPKISDGEYEFIVKACNDEGVFGKTAARIKIVVSSPFWKRWWFFVLCFALASGLVILLIKLRERNQKKIRLYLERQLQLRTRELVEQKSLVEEKNKDITDSINYAHKIQSGLLPSISEIKKHVPDCFILNKPRDIVSGDFYWYTVKENIFSFAVADCTGHGVPGAFMSMIGNTIFREISKEAIQADPGGFIKRVDEHVSTLMNPDRKTQFQDGMDMVIIELDLQTGHVVFSGASRPLLQFKKDGTYIMHKTNSDSVGGYKLNKTFANHHIKLEKGDTLYLYSDGIVDQFGAGTGKKIMTSGLVNKISEMFNMPMHQQGDALEAWFEAWKGDEYQIDDVLLVGIRFS